MTDIRSPVVAGRFYAGDKSGLSKQIEDCFKNPHGPGEIPEVQKGSRKIVGLVSPHAGYPYSGPVAAHGYSKLARDGKPERVVILGPNHSGLGSDISIDSSDSWKTPLGEIRIDDELRRKLLDNTGLIELDSLAHSKEHSIEVQLPFLQYFFGNDSKFVPICMKNQNLKTSEELGRAIEDSIDESTLVIASTDLTHYEPQKTAEEKDRKAIEKMKKLDWKGLINLVSDENLSVCGYGPVASTILASKGIGGEKGELFKYATSGDTAGPSDQVVGYCSLGFYR